MVRYWPLADPALIKGGGGGHKWALLPLQLVICIHTHTYGYLPITYVTSPPSPENTRCT